jgi:hypothetical protein
MFSDREPLPAWKPTLQIGPLRISTAVGIAWMSSLFLLMSGWFLSWVRSTEHQSMRLNAVLFFDYRTDATIYVPPLRTWVVAATLFMVVVAGAAVLLLGSSRRSQRVCGVLVALFATALTVWTVLVGLRMHKLIPASPLALVLSVSIGYGFWAWLLGALALLATGVLMWRDGRKRGAASAELMDASNGSSSPSTT